MMTAMARLPCKQMSPSQHHHQQQQQQQQQHHHQQQQQQQQQQHHHHHQQQQYQQLPQARYSSSGQLNSPPSYVQQSRGYWDMQQPVVSHPAPPPAFVRNHHGRHHLDHMGKRKSAVELLAESKAFYVKSETVLDREQKLKNSGHLQVSQLTAPGAPPRLLRKSCGPAQNCALQQQQAVAACCGWTNCHESDRPTLPPKSPRLVPLPQRRSMPASSNNNVTVAACAGGSNNNNAAALGSSTEQLQAKLRRLLNTDSKENVFFPEAVVVPPAEYASPPLLNGAREDKFRYSPGGSLSPGCRDDERAWSALPSNEAVRFKFGRSNSHSHATVARTRSGGSSGRSSVRAGSAASSASSTAPATHDGVCHKSLPDLHHSSTRRRASLSPRTSTKSKLLQQQQQQQQQCCPDCETGSDYSDRSFNRDSMGYRSSRHIRRSMGSGGGDASSVLSSGGRTQKSSGSSKLSHGANARDSGGSSGHCTHRSEPPPRIQDCWSHVRRDSGASTQHSTERDRSRKSSSGGAVSYSNATPPPAIVRHYSPESDNSSNSQTDYSPTCNSRFSDGWKEGRGRPILRSKSDISDRYWLRESGTAPRSSKHQGSHRPARSITQLESFFDRLGLDHEDYQSIAEPSSKASSPVFFDSVSSVDSALGLYPSWAASNSTAMQWANNCSTGEECLGGAGGQRSGDPPSIVERNARIIKWLCQCRKAQFGYS